jgi:hypothetical protein
MLPPSSIPRRSKKRKTTGDPEVDRLRERNELMAQKLKEWKQAIALEAELKKYGLALPPSVD